MIDSSTSVWKNNIDFHEFIPWESQGEYREDGAVERALKAVSGRSLDAVITFWEDIAIVAARIATELGVAVSPTYAFRTARNKLQTRASLAQTGLPVPKFAGIGSVKDVKKASDYVGFPAVLKPATGAARIGVKRVDSEKEVESAFNSAMKSSQVLDSSVLTHISDMILEEIYVGVECDVDLLLCGGKKVYATVIDNWACLPLWFQELSSNCPSRLPVEAREELISYAVDTVRAIGFLNGVLHVELIWSNNNGKKGARLIEVNARMGGGPMHEINLVPWVVDLAEHHALVSCCIPIAPIISKSPLRYIAHFYFSTPFSGVMNRDNWLDYALDKTYKLEYMKQFGDCVQGPEDGVPDNIGRVYVVSNKNMKDASNKMCDIALETRVPITEPFYIAFTCFLRVLAYVKYCLPWRQPQFT